MERNLSANDFDVIYFAEGANFERLGTFYRVFRARYLCFSRLISYYRRGLVFLFHVYQQPSPPCLTSFQQYCILVPHRGDATNHAKNVFFDPKQPRRPRFPMCFGVTNQKRNQPCNLIFLPTRYSSGIVCVCACVPVETSSSSEQNSLYFVSSECLRVIRCF